MNGDRGVNNKIILLLKVLGVNLLLVAEFALAFWKPIVACAVFLLIIVSVVVFCILRPFPDTEDYAERIMRWSEMNRASKLLRYATAVLAFISFLTTAKGMKSYVFEYEWQAYLGSFAVQSILVVFSLLLCHLYSTMGRITGIGDVGKRMLLSALTLFFSISLVVSSVFSYSYIAGNAYKDTWAGDAEAMIQDFLICETGDLKEENERIGRLLLDKIIQMVSGDFGTLIEECVKQQKEGVGAEIEAFQLEVLNFDMNELDIDEYIDYLRGQGLSAIRLSELNSIEKSYHDLNTAIEMCLNEYNDIAQSLSDKLHGTDLESTQKCLEDVYEQLNNILAGITSICNANDNMETFHFQKDLTPIKQKIKLYMEKISRFIEGEKSRVDDLRARITSAENGVATAGGEPILNRLEDIQHDIYLLKASQTVMPDSAQTQSSTKEIVKKIVDLLEDIPMDGTLSSADIAPLAALTDLLSEYEKYLKLSVELQSYQDNNLTKTYSISTYEIQNEADVGAENERELTVEGWRTIRDRDFHLLFSMLKALPDSNVLDLLSEDEGDLMEENTFYEPNDRLQEASSMRRNLIGDITEFERSINYFNSDYNKMAFFSAFIAVFFDLGAFLTGCFLYAVRYIEVEVYKDGDECNSRNLEDVQEKA